MFLPSPGRPKSSLTVSFLQAVAIHAELKCEESEQASFCKSSYKQTRSSGYADSKLGCKDNDDSDDAGEEGVQDTMTTATTATGNIDKARRVLGLNIDSREVPPASEENKPETRVDLRAYGYTEGTKEEGEESSEEDEEAYKNHRLAASTRKAHNLLGLGESSAAKSSQ